MIEFMLKIAKNEVKKELVNMEELNPGDYISRPRIHYSHLAKVMEARRISLGEFPNLFFQNLPKDGM